MSEHNEIESRKLALNPNDLDVESLTVDELDAVAGGGQVPGDSYTCPPSYTCPESYTCPQTYTCPATV